MSGPTVYTYVGNDPLDKTDPSGETCTQSAGSGAYNCQVDSIRDAKGNVTQRADFSKAQVSQVAKFEKSYTAAVNKLASNPTEKATVSVPGGKSETITAGALAKMAAGRQVEAAPSVTNTTIGAVTHGNALTSLITTVNSPGLQGGPAVAGVSSSDEMRQLVIGHEAMHGTYIDNSRGGLSNDAFDGAHQDPYNNAVLQLLGYK